MTLHLVKKLPVATACVAEGRWDERSRISMGDLEGATIGIVGYGRIGRRVAHLARAFGMTVLAHDPYVTEDDPELVGLAELRRRADVITLHLPLTSETHHLVDADFLAGVQRGTILVNCGRGGLLDLDAAHDALEAGQLAGLGLDVFETEPPEHHPVFDRDDVVLSPAPDGPQRGRDPGHLRRGRAGESPTSCPDDDPRPWPTPSGTPSASPPRSPSTHRRHHERPHPHCRSTHQLGGLRGPGLGLPAAPRAGPLPDERGRPGRHRAGSGRLPAR